LSLYRSIFPFGTSLTWSRSCCSRGRNGSKIGVWCIDAMPSRYTSIKNEHVHLLSTYGYIKFKQVGFRRGLSIVTT
jgi:hypothetical protein